MAQAQLIGTEQVFGTGSVNIVRRAQTIESGGTAVATMVSRRKTCPSALAAHSARPGPVPTSERNLRVDRDQSGLASFARTRALSRAEIVSSRGTISKPWLPGDCAAQRPRHRHDHREWRLRVSSAAAAPRWPPRSSRARWRSRRTGPLAQLSQLAPDFRDFVGES